MYECNCEEINFRQTWEIDTRNETISRLYSMDLYNGRVFEGDGYYNNVIWIGYNFIYFLFRNSDNWDEEDPEEDYRDYVCFYRFDLVNNLFISEIYNESDGSLNKNVYECFWYK